MTERRRARKPGIALLGMANTYVDAMMWKDLLEQQGIPCMARDGSATTAYLGGGAMPGAGRMEVYVPASALEKARRILGPALDPETGESPDVERGLPLGWVAAIVGPILVLGVIGYILIVRELL